MERCKKKKAKANEISAAKANGLHEQSNCLSGAYRPINGSRILMNAPSDLRRIGRQVYGSHQMRGNYPFCTSAPDSPMASVSSH
eukprot:scaffold4820_cov28-Tisochrysis_lutea.AAC.1